MKRIPYYARMPEVFRRFDYPGGGCLWIHDPSGAAVAGRAVCPDGVARAVRFTGGGQPVYIGAWSGSVRIRGRSHSGRAYISESDPDRPAFRFAPDPK